MRLNAFLKRFTAAKCSFYAFIFHETFVPVNDKITPAVNKSNSYMV